MASYINTGGCITLSLLSSKSAQLIVIINNSHNNSLSDTETLCENASASKSFGSADTYWLIEKENMVFERIWVYLTALNRKSDKWNQIIKWKWLSYMELSEMLYVIGKERTATTSLFPKVIDMESNETCLTERTAVKFRNWGTRMEDQVAWTLRK